MYPYSLPFWILETILISSTALLAVPATSDSCSNQCDTIGHDHSLDCQCNAKCIEYNDCCPDYFQSCLTCDQRCDLKYNSDFPCQCNPKCHLFDDCCSNVDQCGRQTVTDIDLSTLSEDLLSHDVNNVFSLITLNPQGSSCFSCTRDMATDPLLTVSAEAYRKPTIAKLIPLHNNYVPGTGQAEQVTSSETQEETEFLDSILTTEVMKKTEKFLRDKGFVTQTGSRAFRDQLHQIWFGLYSRENRVLGSSGFEHVFLGEVKDGKVSGFHNWVFFSKEEGSNKLNYKGRIGTVVNLGNKGRIIKHKFDWNNKEKPVSSMMVGTSPELEMALYTVCFYSRPGAKCPLKLNGKNVPVQTYYFNKQGKRYVASAYPDI